VEERRIEELQLLSPRHDERRRDEVFVYMCVYIFVYVCVCIYVCVCLCVYTYAYVGRRRMGDRKEPSKLQVSFEEYRLFYRALLQKRPMIRSL